MSLFDIFTFKEKARDLFSAANINKVLNTAKEAIIDQVQKNIPGPEKKANVDQVVISVIESKAADCTNGIVRWVVTLIISAVPSITQTVYDFLKEKIQNL